MRRKWWIVAVAVVALAGIALAMGAGDWLWNFLLRLHGKD